MSDLEKLTGQVEQLVGEVRSRVDALETKNDGVTQAEVKNIEESLKTELKSLREAVAAANAPKQEVSAEEAVAKAKEAFGTYLTYGSNAGERTGSEFNVKSVSLNVAAEGGVFLPKVFSGQMTDLLRKYSPLRGLATVVQSGQNYVHPIKLTKGAARTRLEKGAVSAGTEPTFDLMTFTPIEVYDEQAATVWAHDGDAQINLVDIIMQDIAAGMGEKEGDLFLNSTTQNGLSSGGNVKMGICANTAAAAATRFDSSLGTLHGVNVATTNLVTFDDILNLRASLHGKYLANAKYIMDAATELALLKVKDGQGRYIMCAGDVTGSTPGSLFGNGYIIDDNMGDSSGAAGTPVLLLGDFSKYVIVDHNEIRWTVDPISDKTVVQYLARRRTAAGLTDFQAVRALFDI